jgi:hypothetical protein
MKALLFVFVLLYFLKYLAVIYDFISSLYYYIIILKIISETSPQSGDVDPVNTKAAHDPKVL